MEYPVEALMDRYCFYRQKYVLMTHGFIRAMPHKYTKKQVWEHLTGSVAMCVYAGPSMTTFLTLDVDLQDREVVRSVIDAMEGLGIPRELIYVSDSGGKGFHIDVYFTEAIYNWKAKELYELIIYFSGANRRKVEYRPTAKQSIKLPLGIHQKTGRRCWFVDRETLEPIEDFNYIEGTEKMNVALVDGVIEAGNKARFKEQLAEAREKHAQPRITRKGESQEVIRIEETGTRQKKMIEEALRLYRNGGDENSIICGLAEWLRVQDITLYKDTQEECERNILNITKWVMEHGKRGQAATQAKRPEEWRFRIYRSDALRIIQAPTKAARMLSFFITACCDVYGDCGYGTGSLCELLGIKSNKTIVTASKWLEESGTFAKKRGGFRSNGVRLQAVTNKYYFPDGYERSGEYVDLNGKYGIYPLYIRTLAALCNDSEVKCLSERERKDIDGAKDTVINARWPDGVSDLCG